MNGQKQVYPVNQGYTPIGYAPMRSSAPAGMIPGGAVPMNSAGGGIPIGPLIGLIGGLIQTAMIEDAREKQQKNIMKQEDIYNMNTSAGSSPSTQYYNPNAPLPKRIPYYKQQDYKKEVTVDNTSFYKKENLLEGTRISNVKVKSPYSDFIIDTSTNNLLPGHIITDHSVNPKKNFVIPKETKISTQED